HLILHNEEERVYFRVTDVYSSLSVMNTLGYGDITFSFGIGRAFSVLVLLCVLILLREVLPFAFIRYFYAPWLEAQLRNRVPVGVPPGMKDHVIFIAWDSVAQDMAPRLEGEGVPYFVIAEDGADAAALQADGISTVRGMVDDLATYENLLVSDARLVILNRDDLMNTNVALTIRELSADVPIVAF